MTLQEYRHQKDAFFASARSPLPARARAGFQGLAYYPENPALAFADLPLEPDPSREAVVMSTSTGDERVYERLGWVRFVVDGTETRLALYAPEGEEPEAAFVPFRDATSGVETYGSGRYLEAGLENGRVRLDFNLAYNPYCAYSEGWSCPVPPGENWLAVPIRAGERDLEPEMTEGTHD